MPFAAADRRHPREPSAPCSTPASSWPTRWTSGDAAPTPRTSSPRCLDAVAADPGVDAVALAVDLVEEYDGDESYPRAVRRAAAATDKPVVVLSTVPAALDPVQAADLRDGGDPGARGRAVRAARARPPARPRRPAAGRAAAHPTGRRRGGPAGLARRGRDPGPGGRPRHRHGAPTRAATDATSAAAAAAELGYPVVLKTDEPGIAHRARQGGVVLGLADEDGRAGGVPPPRGEPRPTRGRPAAAGRDAARSRSAWSTDPQLGRPGARGPRRQPDRGAGLARGAPCRGRPRGAGPARRPARRGVPACGSDRPARRGRRARCPARRRARRPSLDRARRQPAASSPTPAAWSPSTHCVRVSRYACSGNGSAIGSAASRERPVVVEAVQPERGRRRPRRCVPWSDQVGDGAGDAGAPHHPVAAGGGDPGAGHRDAAGSQQRADDRQVVGGVVDGRRPGTTEAEARGDRAPARPSGRASARSTRRRTTCASPGGSSGLDIPHSRPPSSGRQ